MTDQLRQAAQQALDFLMTRRMGAEAVIDSLNTALEQQAEPVQEPVEVDQATMELAESVGLIGPTSRTHDLHQAIQRFHDLICVNATVKAAQMAVDVIRESTPPQREWVGLTDEDWAAIEDMPDTFDQGVAWAAARLKERNT